MRTIAIVKPPKHSLMSQNHSSHYITYNLTNIRHLQKKTIVYWVHFTKQSHKQHSTTTPVQDMYETVWPSFDIRTTLLLQHDKYNTLHGKTSAQIQHITWENCTNTTHYNKNS